MPGGWRGLRRAAARPRRVFELWQVQHLLISGHSPEWRPVGESKQVVFAGQ